MKRTKAHKAPKKDAPRKLRVSVVFVGGAVEKLDALLRRGLSGSTMQLVVEGLALTELRRLYPIPKSRW